MRKQITKVFHALICESDESYLKALCDSVRHYSKEYRIMITIHSCLTMPLNPKDVVDLGILVDLVVINTNFSDGRGIDIAKSIQRGKSPTPIIFITEKQLDWEDMNLVFPIGILEYPIAERNLELLFQRILGQIFFSKYKEQQHLRFRMGLSQIEIECNNIIALKKVENEIVVETKQGDFPVKSTLKELEEKLPFYFIRINRSVIINGDEIEQVAEKEKVRMKNDEEFAVGTAYVRKVAQFCYR